MALLGQSANHIKGLIKSARGAMHDQDRCALADLRIFQCAERSRKDRTATDQATSGIREVVREHRKDAQACDKEDGDNAKSAAAHAFVRLPQESNDLLFRKSLLHVQPPGRG
jgi:hypothetical protein